MLDRLQRTHLDFSTETQLALMKHDEDLEFLKKKLTAIMDEVQTQNKTLQK